ncbi:MULTISPECIES: hypothetical protein [unclassified Streptomyces]|uniref:hypothetical protein n=1 Tax=unclassified Streptomyces TaxID=2593676 RepID=UPI00278BEBDC|nr:MULTISPECIES: hypothetical protein [unclassified Streptomyces]
MTTQTLTAGPGRRIVFSGFASDPTPRPGVITGVDGDALLIRLDGTRYNLRIVPDRLPATKHLHLLNEIGPVPDLPMGPFAPTADVRNAIYELDGVLYATVGEDGESLIVVTDDLDVAKTVARHHAKATDLVLDDAVLEGFEAEWSQFVWTPEGSLCPWVLMPASKDDEYAVHVHCLPIN